MSDAEPRATLPYAETVRFESGTQWASPPVRLETDWTVQLDCIGTVRFYAMLATSDYFDTVRAPGGAFPFEFGTDRTAHLKDYRIEKTGYYRILLRVGVFSNGGSVDVRLWKVE